MELFFLARGTYASPLLWSPFTGRGLISRLIATLILFDGCFVGCHLCRCNFFYSNELRLDVHFVILNDPTLPASTSTRSLTSTCARRRLVCIRGRADESTKYINERRYTGRGVKGSSPLSRQIGQLEHLADCCMRCLGGQLSLEVYRAASRRTYYDRMLKYTPWHMLLLYMRRRCRSSDCLVIHSYKTIVLAGDCQSLHKGS